MHVLHSRANKSNEGEKKNVKQVQAIIVVSLPCIIENALFSIGKGWATMDDGSSTTASPTVALTNTSMIVLHYYFVTTMI
jgi:hypothetical protein